MPLLNSNSFSPLGMENTRITVPWREGGREGKREGGREGRGGREGGREGRVEERGGNKMEGISRIKNDWELEGGSCG